MGKLDLRDFQIALLMKDGILDINPIKGLAGNGDINGSINLDGSADIVDLDMNIVVDSLPMPNLGGEMDLNIDLDGDGASVADIMGTLNGQLLLVMRDGEIAHSFVTNFGSGLFSFTGNKDTTELECAILRMDIEDGLADFDDKLAVQMTDVNWRGGGQINFKTEKLGVGITPKPRAGLGISIAGLADLVYIGGTLKEPKVLPNPKDIAVQYGKYMAYLSTGGLSLVAEALFNKSQANVDMCEQILDGTVFDVTADDIIKAQEEAETKAQEEAEAAGSEE